MNYQKLEQKYQKLDDNHYQLMPESMIVDARLRNQTKREVCKKEFNKSYANKIFNKDQLYLKQEFQKWLQEHSFSHCVVVQPTPQQWFDEDEITRRFRKIIFKINKYFLKNSFLKWIPDDKFWMIGFQEGNEKERNIHYHFLLHTPKTAYKNEDDFNPDFIKRMINKEWLKIPSINRRTFKYRNDLHEVLEITKTTNNFSAVNYSSKKYNPKNENEQPIYIGLQDKVTQKY